MKKGPTNLGRGLPPLIRAMPESKHSFFREVVPNLRQVLWEDIWKYTVEKSQTNATNVILYPIKPCDLTKHLQMHSGIEPNKCDLWKFASSRVFSLQTHLKMHRREKSNNRNQCDYLSSRANDLRRHLKTHSGEKPNKCNQCNYASSHASDLSRHLKTHTREKPNKCN